MENVIEALKIAFGVMMFVLALTLSISSFSQAREAIDNVIMMKDREQEYTYVETAANLKNRLVSSETIIPTIYKAYKENFSVEFYKSDGVTPLYLYTAVDTNYNKTNVYYIDLEREILGNATNANKHLDILLGKKSDAPDTFRDEFIYPDGLYEFFKNNTFKECLGEYYQEDALPDADTDATLEINKTKKRVITYILQEPAIGVRDP